MDIYIYIYIYYYINITIVKITVNHMYNLQEWYYNSVSITHNIYKVLLTYLIAIHTLLTRLFY